MRNLFFCRSRRARFFSFSSFHSTGFRDLLSCHANVGEGGSNRQDIAHFSQNLQKNAWGGSFNGPSITAIGRP